MAGPRFDFTINLGHILTFGSILLTLIVGWNQMDQRIARVEETLKNSTATLVEQVKQGSDLRALADRVSRNERLIEQLQARLGQ